MKYLLIAYSHLNLGNLIWMGMDGRINEQMNDFVSHYVYLPSDMDAMLIPVKQLLSIAIFVVLHHCWKLSDLIQLVLVIHSVLQLLNILMIYVQWVSL